MPKTNLSFDATGYAPVADRITLFYARYPSGRILTELVSRADGEITFKALVYREPADAGPAATGWASEREGDGDVNAVACLENTETSAIGRALANLGFTASVIRASREEMEKAERARRRLSHAGNGAPAPAARGHPAAVREAAPAGRSLQVHADAALDLLHLLKGAQARGFSSARADVIRRHVRRMPPLPLVRVRKLEGATRAWLRRKGL